MKETEVRIGNWINSKEDEADNPMQVADIAFDERCQCYFINNHNLEDSYPVAITTGWLLEFGFKNNDLYNYSINYKRKELRLFKVAHYFTICLSEFYIRIEFVHQLQNLYFALTGEELKLVKR